MGKVLAYLPRIQKAITAGIAAGVAAYGTAQSGGVTTAEWLGIAGAVLGAGLLTWAVPNKVNT